jgi:hypothetical protein
MSLNEMHTHKNDRESCERERAASAAQLQCVSNVHKGLLHLSLWAAFLSTHQRAREVLSLMSSTFPAQFPFTRHHFSSTEMQHGNFYVIFHSRAAGGMKLKVLAANQLSQCENRRK